MREFESYLQTVMESLVNQLGKDLTETDKRVEVLKSKFFLIDVCFEKAVEVLALNLPKGYDNSVVQLFTSLRNQICTSFVTMSQMQNSTNNSEKFNQIRLDLEEKFRIKETEMQQVQKRKDEDFNKVASQIEDMKDVLTKMGKCLPVVREWSTATSNLLQ